MAVRQQHYFIYDADDIRPDAIAFEILSFEDHFRECPVPLLYLCRDLGDASRMLEEAVHYREHATGISGLERTTDYFFQVQRTRLISLNPVDSERKWATFRKVVEAYNLGDVGCCSNLADFLAKNGPRLIEAARGRRAEKDAERLSLPGNESFVAELINSYNWEAVGTQA